MKKDLTIFIVSILCMCLLAGCGCNHEWLDATCTSAKTCSVCGESEGVPSGHHWLSPTCTTAKTCKVCGETEGDPSGHNWAKAFRIETCTVCGKESDLSLIEEKEQEETKPQEDSVEQLLNEAESLALCGNYTEAIQLLDSAWVQHGNQQFYDASTKYRIDFGCYNCSTLAAGEHNSAVLKKDGSLTVVGRNKDGELAANSWTDLVAVSLGDKHIVGLKADGTVVAAGSNVSGRCNVANWRNIVAISAGDSHTVALASDGCVLATGYDEYGQCQVDTLMDAAGDKRIVSIAAGYYHTVALLEDGTAVACGDDRFNASYVQRWTDLAAIYAGSMYTAGLKTDGTVVVTGQYVDDWDVSDWTDIVNLAAGDSFLVGVKSDGTVIYAGIEGENLINTHRSTHYWENIVHISVGYDHTVAMNADGDIFCAGVNNFGQCDLANATIPATITEPTPQASIPSSHSVPDPSTTVSYILFDRMYEPIDMRVTEYANVVGMNESGDPVWIYMTDHYLGYLDQRVKQIGQIGNLYFIYEDETITALNCATGQPVWQHINSDLSSDIAISDSNGNFCISNFAHDIYVTAEGIISCADENCNYSSVLSPVTPAKNASEVRFDYFYYQNEHGEGDRANIVGLDKNQNPVWIYRSSSDDNHQVSPIEEIGTYGNTYYFLDNGTLTALDIKTGKLLWQNTDIHLAGVSSFIDTNGTIYLCGFLWHDFVVINTKGEMLKYIEMFDEDYFWPCAIEKKSGKIYVVFSGTSSEPYYHYNAFAVNLKDYSYELIPNYPYSHSE